LNSNDISTWAEFFTDDDATRFHPNPDNRQPAARAEEWVQRSIHRYQNNLYGLQALIANETEEFVGMCGLIIQEVNGAPVVEIGYHLLKKHWGNGYATEAAQMFRDYAFENGLADSIVSIIHPDNENSKRVAKRNSMRLVQSDARFRDSEYNLFRITKEEWLEMKEAK
jgi:RimJ/RimL family protein N-acetyltransferase